MKTPMTLWLGTSVCGLISSYGYETPWASGRFEPTDADQHRRWVEACELETEIETWPEDDTPAAEEARWQAALIRRGITQADLDSRSRGPWQIEAPAGSKAQILSPPCFDRQGFVTWRW